MDGAADVLKSLPVVSPGVMVSVSGYLINPRSITISLTWFTLSSVSRLREMIWLKGM